MMNQRTLIACCFGLLVLGQGSVSEAGGFLRRLLGRSESRPILVSNTSTRACTPVEVVSVKPVEVEKTASCCGDAQVKKDDRGQIVHVPLNAEQTYEKNCKACEQAYEDPDKREKCKEIAKSLLEKMSRKDYVAYTPVQRPCACAFPEEPSGESCFLLYEIEVRSTDPDIRRCAAECYFYCLLASPEFFENSVGK